jgi:nucleoid-associated protein YgaU
MPSLSVHLQLEEDHSGLPFHPSCPICRRDRLAGPLGGDELVSRRAQATIAAGLLAFSGVGAPTAMASDPDTVSEGTAEVVDGAEPDSLDIGGDTLQLVDEPVPAPEATAPPTEAASSPLDDAEAAPLEAEAVDPPAEAIDDAAAPPAEAQATPDLEPTTPPAAEAPTVNSATETSGMRAERSKRLNVKRAQPAQITTHTTPAVTVSAEPPPSIASPAPAGRRKFRVVAGTSTGGAARGDRFHTVRPGESLWSIASDLLGDRASTARVASEVNRLWQLNEDRIGSGSPDLVYPGTRLRLR